MRKLSPIGWAVRPLKNYAKFSGRASRAEMWWFMLFAMVFYVGAIIVAGAGVSSFVPRPGVQPNFGGFGILFGFIGLFWLALFVPMIAVQVRRLHDTDRSGWWLGGFWLLYAVYLVAMLGMGFAADRAASNSSAMVVAVGVMIFGLAIFVYSIALLVFWCLPGTRGANRFGADPYGADFEEVFA